VAYDPRIKAAAAADLIRGDSFRQVASRYGIGASTVARWARDLELPRPEPDAPENGTGVPKSEQCAVLAQNGGIELPGAGTHRFAQAAFVAELERLMAAMATTPRRLLERIGDGEMERIEPERVEAIGALLRAASDVGYRLLEAASAILARHDDGAVRELDP